MASPPTKTGTRLLSEVARHVVRPSGIVSTGWPAVRDKCKDLGVTFDAWQDGSGRLILAKRADGKLAAMVGGVGMSLPRQVGKTYLLAGLIFALAILRPGLLVIWTAHHSRTFGETFLAMQAFARRRRIAPYVEAVPKGSGDEAVIFRNGSRILFGARERGFGRGIPGVDILVADEAQILTDKALDDMLATLNTSDLGLALFVGTPPKPNDPSEAFTRMRQDALSGSAEDTVWIECGADPDALPDDREQWAKANPSFPHRTPVESILRLRKKLTLSSFMREALGIWDESGASAFGAGNWDACAGRKPAGLKITGLAVAATLDMTHCALGAAGVDDGVVHVKPLQHGPGSYWVVQRLVDLGIKAPVVVDRYGPAAPLIPHIEAAGFEVISADTHDVLDACSRTAELVRDRQLRHDSYDELDLAVKGAVRREVRDRWAWGRKQSTSDISTLEAITLAAWQASLPLEKKVPPPPPVSLSSSQAHASDSVMSTSF